MPSPVKVEDNPNQFAPQGINPKEFKQKFQQIKKEYYTESVTAGPQSRILEGVTWDEAQQIKVGVDGRVGVNVPLQYFLSVRWKALNKSHEYRKTIVVRHLFVQTTYG